MNELGYENGMMTAFPPPSSSEWPSLVEAAPAATAESDPDGANQRLARWAARLQRAACEDGAYLIPLRLFIGLGWLRAGAEKVLDPAWQNGSSLAVFLSDQVSGGAVAFPWYETLIAHVFLPHAAALALLIVLGQILAGVAISAGVLTNAALLGGLFVNLNFLLAGAPNPSAFYIVIQIALLLTHSGAILGLDAGLARIVHNPLLVAQPRARRRRRRARVPLLTIGAISLFTAVYGLAHVTDWSPAGSVEDPAMIVAILALLCLVWAMIAWLRRETSERRARRRRDTRSAIRLEHTNHCPSGDPRLRQIGVAVTEWMQTTARARSRWGLRRPQRWLALTITLTRLVDKDDGSVPQGQPPADAAPRTGLRAGG